MAGASLKVKGGGALPPIADRVVVGTCDVAGVGVRALMGLKPGGDGTTAKGTTHELELHGVGERRTGGGGDGDGEDGACVSGGGAVFTTGGDPDLAEGTPEILLINLPGITLIAVNTSLSVAEEAPFAAAVHALTADAGCSSVVLVGALRLNVKARENLHSFRSTVQSFLSFVLHHTPFFIYNTTQRLSSICFVEPLRRHHHPCPERKTEAATGLHTVQLSSACLSTRAD